MSKLSEWRKNRKNKKEKSKEKKNNNSSSTDLTKTNSKPTQPTEQLQPRSSPQIVRPSLTESKSNTSTISHETPAASNSVPTISKTNSKEVEPIMDRPAVPASSVNRPSNPRVQQLKEKLGLLNDVSTSSDEDVPEHHLPPHMVSGPSAVSAMAPPPNTSMEPPREESRERVPTVMNPNPSSAPTANTFVPQDQKSGRQRISEWAQGTTPAQSVQNSARPDPDAANIPRTLPPPAAVGRDTHYGHSPIIPPPQYNPQQPSYDESDYSDQDYSVYNDSRQAQSYEQYPTRKTATISNVGKVFTVADILLVATGLALAVGTFVRRSRKDRPKMIAADAYGLPKKQGVVKKLFSKVKNVISDEPMYKQPLEASGPYPLYRNSMPMPFETMQ